MSTPGPTRNLSLGDECPVCGRVVTEICAGGLLAYCWYCVDRYSDELNYYEDE